jgi:hypothetical protein
MRIKFKYSMTFEKADQLIERYYEGLTSVDEERQLQEFLSQADLPLKYEPEQAIFGYFRPQKQNVIRKSFLRWSGVAAALLVGVFAIQLFNDSNLSNYAYVDGKKITDMDEIKLHAMASIENLPSGQTIVEENLRQVSSKELIEQQLNLFSAFE